MLGIGHEPITHHRKRMRHARLRPIIENPQRADEPAPMLQFETSDLVDDEQFGIPNAFDALATAKLIEVLVCAGEGVVVDSPTKRGLIALRSRTQPDPFVTGRLRAPFRAPASASRKKIATGCKANALVLRKQDVVDADLLAHAGIIIASAIEAADSASRPIGARHFGIARKPPHTGCDHAATRDALSRKIADKLLEPAGFSYLYAPCQDKEHRRVPLASLSEYYTALETMRAPFPRA